MSKSKFKQRTRVISGREARRYNQREQAKEERQKAVEAWWALPPEVRKERMEASETFQRINKNGITLDDMKRAEEKAYHDGVQAGIENTMQTCYAAICLALHELHGFGRKRCGRVLNSVDEKVIMTLTSEDAIREVMDTMRLKIEFSDMPGERVQEVG